MFHVALQVKSTKHRSTRLFSWVENNLHFRGQFFFFSSGSVILNCDSPVNAFLTSCHVRKVLTTVRLTVVRTFLINLPWRGGLVVVKRIEPKILLFQETVAGKDSCQAGIQIYRH